MWSCDYNRKKERKIPDSTLSQSRLLDGGLTTTMGQNRVQHSWASIAFFLVEEPPSPRKTKVSIITGLNCCHGGGKADAWLSLHSVCSNRDNFPLPAPSIPNTAPHPENSRASTKPGPGAKPWGVNNSYVSGPQVACPLRIHCGEKPAQLLPAGDLIEKAQFRHLLLSWRDTALLDPCMTALQTPLPNPACISRKWCSLNTGAQQAGDPGVVGEAGGGGWARAGNCPKSGGPTRTPN